MRAAPGAQILPSSSFQQGVLGVVPPSQSQLFEKDVSLGTAGRSYWSAKPNGLFGFLSTQDLQLEPLGTYATKKVL